MSVALVESNLSEKVAKNISKCIKMYAVKTEQQLATGSDANQVIGEVFHLVSYSLQQRFYTGGSANNGQRLNVQLANAMFYFQLQIQRILSNMKESLPLSSINIINDSLQSLDNLTNAVLQPLVGQCCISIWK